MRVGLVVLILVFAAHIINFVRAGNGFHVAEVVPFLGGRTPGIYDVGAIVMIGIAIAGLRKLYRRSD